MPTEYATCIEDASGWFGNGKGKLVLLRVVKPFKIEFSKSGLSFLDHSFSKYKRSVLFAPG